MSTHWNNGQAANLGSRKEYSGTMRERVNPISAPRISAVWYDLCNRRQMVCTNLPHFKVVERIFGMHRSDSLWMATLNLSNPGGMS